MIYRRKKAMATTATVTAKGSGFASFLKKLLHVVEAPFTNAKKLEQVFEAVDKGIVEAPQAKTLVVGLVQQFETISPDAIAAIAGEGVNVPADEKTLADVAALFSYFKNTFVPGLEAIYKSVKSELTGDVALPAAAASTQQPPPAPVQNTGAVA
jgi:hypothetical protein